MGVFHLLASGYLDGAIVNLQLAFLSSPPSMSELRATVANAFQQPPEGSYSLYLFHDDQGVWLDVATTALTPFAQLCYLPTGQAPFLVETLPPPTTPQKRRGPSASPPRNMIPPPTISARRDIRDYYLPDEVFVNARDAPNIPTPTRLRVLFDRMDNGTGLVTEANLTSFFTLVEIPDASEKASSVMSLARTPHGMRFTDFVKVAETVPSLALLYCRHHDRCNEARVRECIVSLANALDDNHQRALSVLRSLDDVQTEMHRIDRDVGRIHSGLEDIARKAVAMEKTDHDLMATEVRCVLGRSKVEHEELDVYRVSRALI